MARFTQGGSGDGSGVPGPQGVPGQDGDSAYDIAVANGFIGTEQEWLNSLSADASDIADFIFTNNGTESTVTLPGDKDMSLSSGSTSDLFLTSGHDAYLTGGRDVFIESTIDDIHLGSNDDITFGTNINDPLASNSWRLTSEGGLVFPDNTVQTTAFTGLETGPQGPQGPAGADALWNFVGEYNNGADYNIGDVVTYAGGTYYRVGEPNPGYPPGTSYWTTIAEPGIDGIDGEPGTNGIDGTNGADFGIYYLGNYVSTNGYITDIAVVRGSDGQLYLAKASGQLGDPIDYQTNGQWEVWIPKGADGAQGVPGPQGDVGPQGIQGEPGLDANLDTGTTTINSYNPIWSGTDLAYTGTPTTGSYIKIGNLVQVQIDVLFTDVTDFGTGQYSLTLPLPSKYHTDVYGGSIHNITNQGIDHYSLKAHLSPASSTMTIWNIGSSAQDQPFDHNSPFILTNTDRLHMSFSYICE